MIKVRKMNSLESSKNVFGMGDIISNDDVEEIEKSIMNGNSVIRQPQPVDIAKDYSSAINSLNKKFQIASGDSKNTNFNKNTNDFSQNNKFSQNDDEADLGASKQLDDLFKFNDNDFSNNDDAQSVEFNDDNRWSADNPVDSQLSRMTIEERKQNHVNQVLSNIPVNNDDAEFVQQEDDEEELSRIIEQVDCLKKNLESSGVDLSRIPDVDASTSKKEAKSILRILQIKNDRARYCDFFEEGILAVAYGLENIFNGEREVLGSKIDLTGYSNTVKIKLLRMRYDTSTFISGVMQGYNINSGWRIILELIPSLFLYSRDRKKTSKDNLISDEQYKDALLEYHK